MELYILDRTDRRCIGLKNYSSARNVVVFVFKRIPLPAIYRAVAETGQQRRNAINIIHCIIQNMGLIVTQRLIVAGWLPQTTRLTAYKLFTMESNGIKHQRPQAPASLTYARVYLCSQLNHSGHYIVRGQTTKRSDAHRSKISNF